MSLAPRTPAIARPGASGDDLEDRLRSPNPCPAGRTDGELFHAARSCPDASAELRRQYFKGVGTVLREVDACCIEPEPDDERRGDWGRLNEFAAEIVDWAATRTG